MRKLWILVLVLLVCSSVATAKTEAFQMQNTSGLNFELGYYKIEVIEISKPGDLTFAKVKIISGDSSKTFILYDSEGSSPTKNAGLPYNKTEIRASMFDIGPPSYFRLNITYPDDWSTPVKYAIETPEVIEASRVPNIVVTKSASKTNINIGDVVEIKIKVENTGNGTANNLTLIEYLPDGFTRAAGSRFPPVLKENLDPGASDEIYYALEGVKAGTFTIESTKVVYGSVRKESNPVSVTIAREVKEKSNLTTAISIDKNDVMTGESVNVVVKITNIGNASAESILVDGLVDGSVSGGMKLEEGDLRQVYKKIEAGESESYSVILKAVDGGNYSIRLKTSYNDDTVGYSTSSETISVTKKEKNPVDYWYIIIPSIGIIIAVLLFTMRKHKEYRY